MIAKWYGYNSKVSDIDKASIEAEKARLEAIARINSMAELQSGMTSQIAQIVQDVLKMQQELAGVISS